MEDGLKEVQQEEVCDSVKVRGALLDDCGVTLLCCCSYQHFIPVNTKLTTETCSSCFNAHTNIRNKQLKDLISFCYHKSCMTREHRAMGWLWHEMSCRILGSVANTELLWGIKLVC